MTGSLTRNREQGLRRHGSVTGREFAVLSGPILPGELPAAAIRAVRPRKDVGDSPGRVLPETSEQRQFALDRPRRTTGQGGDLLDGVPPSATAPPAGAFHRRAAAAGARTPPSAARPVRA